MNKPLNLFLTAISFIIGTIMVTPALAAEPRECVIEYEIQNLPDPEHRTDVGAIRKEFSACVNSLEECRTRAKALVEHNEDYYRAPGSGDRPDLNSIRVGSTRLTEECSDPI
jgi:hypothetical protein